MFSQFHQSCCTLDDSTLHIPITQEPSLCLPAELKPRSLKPLDLDLCSPETSVEENRQEDFTTMNVKRRPPAINMDAIFEESIEKAPTRRDSMLSDVSSAGRNWAMAMRRGQ